MNQDAAPDLAVARVDSSDVAVFFNSGNGSFTGGGMYAVGDGPRALAHADFDLDGDIDLAVANYGSDDLSILFNNGDGTFAEEVRYPVKSGPVSLRVCDIDADGAPEIAMVTAKFDSSYAVSVLQNVGDGTFEESLSYFVGEEPASVDAADLDGDGDEDIAVANQDSDDISILLNVCSGQCPADLDRSGSVGFEDLLVVLAAWGSGGGAADLDGDGVVGFADLIYMLSHWGPCIRP